MSREKPRVFGTHIMELNNNGLTAVLQIAQQYSSICDCYIRYEDWSDGYWLKMEGLAEADRTACGIPGKFDSDGKFVKFPDSKHFQVSYEDALKNNWTVLTINKE